LKSSNISVGSSDDFIVLPSGRKNKGRNLFEKHRLRLEHNIKIVLKGIGLEVDWNNLAHNRDKKIY
jgi:hypothetical protein